MNKLNVGDYVRLDRCQGINKIIDIENGSYILDEDYYDEFAEETLRLDENDVIKSSPNIIDLTEVGDYVNGYLIIEKDINNELRYIDLKDRNMKYVKNLDIKTIVTHEQFSQTEYKVGDSE